MSPRSGVFITLEGGEGAGKSTAAAALAEMLREEGQDVVLTREPGGTPGAEAIRALLLATATPFSPLAQTLLHFAARADHVAQKIRPALAAGKIVICDRYYDSTMAYQAYGQDVDVAAVASLIRLISLAPDITFILEVPDHVAKDRLKTRGGVTDRYEAMEQEILLRIAHGFRSIAAAEPGRCVLVNAARPVEEIVPELRLRLRERSGR